MKVGRIFVPEQLWDFDIPRNREICGFLYGRRRLAGTVVRGLVQIPNLHPEPATNFKIASTAPLEGPLGRFLGVWHTHWGLDPLEPSDADLQHSMEGYTNLIFNPDTREVVIFNRYHHLVSAQY